MTEGKVIYSILSGNTGVSTLVGTKIYPDAAPQQVAAPYIVYSYETAPVDTKDGHTGTDMTNYAICVWGESPDECNSVAQAVRAAVHFFDGTAAGQTVTIKIDKIETGRSDEAQFFFTLVMAKARIS